MSLFSKVNVSLILIAMVFALAPAATYASAFVKLGDIKGEIKMPRMRVTEKTTVHEVAVFAARHAGVDVDRISLSWRGKELNGRRTLTSYSMPDEVTFQMKISSFRGCVPTKPCPMIDTKKAVQAPRGSRKH